MLVADDEGHGWHEEVDLPQPGSAIAEDHPWARVVGAELGVKASGGVKSMADARAMVEAGATRIGASVGVKIAQEAAGVKSNGRSSSGY